MTSKQLLRDRATHIQGPKNLVWSQKELATNTVYTLSPIKELNGSAGGQNSTLVGGQSPAGSWHVSLGQVPQASEKRVSLSEVTEAQATWRRAGRSRDGRGASCTPVAPMRLPG